MPNGTYGGVRGRKCVKTLAHPLLYFTVLLYFLLAMLLFPGAADFSGWQAFL